MRKKLVTLLIILYFFSIPSGFFKKETSAKNTNTDIPNTQLGEFIAKSNVDNGIPLLEKSRYVNDINSDSFFIIHLPIKRENKDNYATDDANKRANYYLNIPPENFNLVPQLLFNGISCEKFLKQDADSWDMLIKYTKENPKQMGKFSVKEVERNKQFEIEFTTEDKKLLNSNDYNFTVIAYQDWVNINAENGERSYRNVFIEAPLGSTGTGLTTRISKEGIASRTISFKRITEEMRKQSGFVVMMQNKNNKEIAATALCRFANLDGINDPANLNWNNRNEVTVDYTKQGSPSLPEYLENTGINEMTLSVENAKDKDLKNISFEIFQDANDKQRYTILAGRVRQELKNKAEFSFDTKTNKAIITLNEQLDTNSVTKLFTLYEHIPIGDPQHSCGHKISNIRMEDSRGNLIYFDINDIVATSPNQRNTKINPNDFDGDKWIGPKDEEEIVYQFGKMKGDKKWTKETEECDLNKDGRIDARDIAEFELGKDGRKDNYVRAKVVFETNPGSLPNEIQDEIKKELKKIEIFNKHTINLKIGQCIAF